MLAVLLRRGSKVMILAPLFLPSMIRWALRVEIVAGFEVAGDEQDDSGVGMVGTGTVKSSPQRVPSPRACGTNIGMAIVAVYPPGGDAALGVTIFPGAANVVDNAIAALLTAFPHLGGDVVQGFFPGDPLPMPLATLPHPLERIENAFGVVEFGYG